MARLSAIVDGSTISFAGGDLHTVGTPMRTGSGTPSNGTGVDGDLYLNSNTGDVHRRSGGVYSVVGNVRIDETLPIYRPANYTGGVALSDSNIAAAIQAAYDAAASDHTLHGAQGAIVQIPRKANGSPWHMGTTGLDLHGVGYLQNIWIRGPACLQWSHGFTGECIRLRGSTPATGVWGQGGLSDIHIDFDSDDLSTTAKALVLDAVVSASFVNVSAQNLGMGKGLYCREFSVGQNTIGCTFVNTKIVGSAIAIDVEALSTSQMIGTVTQGSRVSSLKIDGCLSLALYGGISQEVTISPIWDFSGSGGSRVVITDWYTEGTAGTETLFSMPQPSVTANQFTIDRYTIQSPVSKFFDSAVFVALNARDINGVAQAATFLKARGTKLHLENCETPDSAPGIFDLDTAALATATFTHYGTARFGGRIHAARLQSDSFVEGVEPTSPAAGDQIFSSTTAASRVYDGTAWHDLAYADAAVTLVDLLTPYAEAILDPRVFANRSVISNQLDTLTDVVNGAVAAAPSSIRRPNFNVSDEKFGGNPSFACANTGDIMLDMPLAHAIPSGSRPAFLAIAYATGAFPEAHPIRRRLFNTDATPFTVLGWDDDDGSAWVLTGAHGNPAVVSAFGDSDPHIFIGSDHLVGGAYTWRGTVDATVGSDVGGGGDLGTSGSAINTVHVGAFDTGATHASNITIGFLAILKAPLPPSVRARAYALAQKEFKRTGSASSITVKHDVAGTYTDTVPAGYRLGEAWLRPGAGGGGGGAGGGAGFGGASGGGGAGGKSSGPGRSGSLVRANIVATEGQVLTSIVGAGGTGGAGSAGTTGTAGAAGAGAAPTAGNAGGLSSIAIGATTLVSAAGLSGGLATTASANGASGAGGAGAAGASGFTWPYAIGTAVAAAGTSGNGGNPGGAGLAGAIPSLLFPSLFGSATYVSFGSAGTGGAQSAGTQGGGGAGSVGTPTAPGDEYISALGTSVPANTVGAGGTAGNGGAGAVTTGVAGTNGGNGAAGTLGRGGGAGGGGGGGGAGTVTGGSGGNGGNGAAGSDGAVVLIFVRS